jgi:hypothetical protein
LVGKENFEGLEILHGASEGGDGLGEEGFVDEVSFKVESVRFSEDLAG